MKINITLEVPPRFYQRMVEGLQKREALVTAARGLTDDEQALCTEAEVDAATAVTKALQNAGVFK